jgi:large repetitive protein
VPTLTIADASVVEGTGAGSTVANFTVTLSAQPAAGSPVTVNYATASGSAVSGTDFTATSGTLTFTSGGALTQTIAVPITRDAIDESDEDFTVTLSAPVNATLGMPSVATGTIQDDDTATPSISNVSLAEGNSGTTAFTFTVSLSTPASTVRNFAAYTVDGSAVAPGDYTAISAATPVGVVFAAGDVEESVTVLVNGDSTVEPNESFQLLLTFPGNGAPEGGGPPVLAAGTGTINNDDSATVAITGSSGPEGNAGTTPLPFTVTLSNPVQGPVSVNFATADGSATVADNDYQAASGTLTFDSLSTTAQTVNVNVVGDLEVEPDQGFTVNLSNLVAPAGVTLGTASATGTILNDDATSFSITGGSVVEGTGANTTLVYTVTSSAPAKDPVSVQYATGGGTATAGVDYTAASGTVTFSGGQTSQTINVTVIGDNLVEPDETVIVTLSNPNGGTIATATATGTIINDDAASLTIADIALPEGTPGLAAAPEGAGGLTPFVFTVTTSNPSATPITVNFQTADGTALAPPDYIAAAGTVTIPAGATTGTLTVQVVPDTMIEPDETFFVNLSGAAGATIADAQAVGTIIGDDLLAPIPTLGEHGRWLLVLLLGSLGAFVLARRR